MSATIAVHAEPEYAVMVLQILQEGIIDRAEARSLLIEEGPEK